MKYILCCLLSFITLSIQAQKTCEFMDVNKKDKTGKMIQSAFFNMAPQSSEATNSQALMMVREGDTIYLALNLDPNKKVNDNNMFFSTPDSLTIYLGSGTRLTWKTDDVRNLGSKYFSGSTDMMTGKTGLGSRLPPYYRIYFVDTDRLNVLSSQLIDRIEYTFNGENRKVYLGRFSKRLLLNFKCILEAK